MVELPGSAGDALHLRGGATIPTEFGLVSTTWPFGHLYARDSGLMVTIRPRWVVRLLRGPLMIAGDSPNVVWAYAWSELERVMVAPRGVMLCPRQGRPCRFVLLDRAPAQTLAQLISGHGVQQERIRSTIGKTIGI